MLYTNTEVSLKGEQENCHLTKLNLGDYGDHKWGASSRKLQKKKS